MKKHILFVVCFLLISFIIPLSKQISAAENNENKIRVIYFYSPDCSNCQQVKPFINEIKETYKDKIEFLEHNVKEKEECRQLFYNFANVYKLSENEAKIPIVFVGKDYLVGTKDIENNLKEKVEQKVKDNEDLLFDCHKFIEDWPDVDKINLGDSDGGEVCSSESEIDYCSVEDNKNNEQESQKKLSLGIVILTAAVDSINPCAIAVLTFLLAVLIATKSSRKKILKIGFVYILAVFLSYYLAGLGLIKIITQFDISLQIKIIAGVIVLLAGFLEIKEGLYPEGKQLLIIPKKTKSLFTGLLKKATIPSVFLAGILVSAFELPCTGQVYLGILSILSQENMRAQGYLYLFVYNLIFVFPLIIIVLVGAWGFNIERMKKMQKKARMNIKILMGITMILLGLFLLFQDKVLELLGI